MAKFLTELEASLLDDDRIWELDAPLIYKSDYFRFPIEVPKGFQTDFNSCPRFQWWWHTKAHRESVIHDYLYRINSSPVVERSVADWMLYEAMVVRNKSWYIRYPIRWGVQLGGGSSYHKRRVEDKLC